jgi:hypothetical protein
MTLFHSAATRRRLHSVTSFSVAFCILLHLVTCAHVKMAGCFSIYLLSLFVDEQEIEKGRKENAEIAASNAIMYKNHMLNYLKTASRIVSNFDICRISSGHSPLSVYLCLAQEAVAGKLDAALKMQKVTKSMAQVRSAPQFSAFQKKVFAQVTYVRYGCVCVCLTDHRNHG